MNENLYANIINILGQMNKCYYFCVIIVITFVHKSHTLNITNIMRLKDFSYFLSL